MAFIVKRRTRAEYNAIPVKDPHIVYFVAEGTSTTNATRYSLFVGDKSVAEEVNFDGYAKETFVNTAIGTHNTSGTAHTDIRGLINTLDGNLEDLQTIVEALEGAYVYRGTIVTDGAEPTPSELNAAILALDLGRGAQLGDVLVTEDSDPESEYNKNEWYFNGTIWNNLGQFIISQATTTVAGIVKLGSNTTIGSLNGNNVITENVLQTIVNTQLLRKDLDKYVKTVNGAVGDVTIHGLNILMAGEILGKQLQSVVQSVYTSAANKVDLPYGSNLDAESHDIDDVIRIRTNTPELYWQVAGEQEWGMFMESNPANLLDDFQFPANPYITGYNQNYVMDYANSNYPPELLGTYEMVRGFAVADEAQDEGYYYAVTLANTPQYTYYKVVAVNTADDRTVSGAINEAEGKITSLETTLNNSLNWDD